MTSLVPAGGGVLAAAADGLPEQIVRDGGDPEAVLASSGVDIRLLGNMRATIDLDCYVQAIECAATSTGNDNFGLHYGQGFRPERLGLIGMVALASPDLGTALANLARFFPYHQQKTQTAFYERGGVCRLEYRIASRAIVKRRQDAELTLGMFANIARSCVGSRWAPEEVHCEHPKPEAWGDHERQFNAPVYFSQETNAILFRRTEMSERMPGANPARLAELIGEIASLTGNPPAITVTEKVCNEIRAHLADEAYGIEQIARNLQTQRWKLQRALDREGTNFIQLVDQVRRQLSLVYLRCWHLSLTEIALLLGYSELSAFTRSFSRWHSISPSAWRRSAKPQQ